MNTQNRSLGWLTLQGTGTQHYWKARDGVNTRVSLCWRTAREPQLHYAPDDDLCPMCNLYSQSEVMKEADRTRQNRTPKSPKWDDEEPNEEQS